MVTTIYRHGQSGQTYISDQYNRGDQFKQIDSGRLNPITSQVPTPRSTFSSEHIKDSNLQRTFTSPLSNIKGVTQQTIEGLEEGLENNKLDYQTAIQTNDVASAKRFLLQFIGTVERYLNIKSSNLFSFKVTLGKVQENLLSDLKKKLSSQEHEDIRGIHQTFCDVYNSFQDKQLKPGQSISRRAQYVLLLLTSMTMSKKENFEEDIDFIKSDYQTAIQNNDAYSAKACLFSLISTVEEQLVLRPSEKSKGNNKVTLDKIQKNLLFNLREELASPMNGKKFKDIEGIQRILYDVIHSFEDTLKPGQFLSDKAYNVLSTLKSM